MVDKIDNIAIGDLYTANYLKNSGLIRSQSFLRIYEAKYRSDLTSTSPSVVNDGASDFSNVFEITEIKKISASSVDVETGGFVGFLDSADNTSQKVFDKVDTIVSPLEYAGAIALASDFPDPLLVENGWVYVINAVVTDNDPTKTNTGQTFVLGEKIAWNEYNDDWDVISNDKAEGTSYNNTTSGLSANDVQDAIDEIISGATHEKVIYNPDYIATGSEATGTRYYNSDFKTTSLVTGTGSILDDGQEIHIYFYNDTGSIIPNGTVMRPKAGILVGSNVIPTFELARADIHSGAEGTLAITTSEVGIGGFGHLTKVGRVKDVDLSSFSIGNDLYLSSTIAGALTNVRPSFPNYNIKLGGVLNNAVSGELFVSITTKITDTFFDAWDGSIRETIRLNVASNGTVITGTLTNQDFPANDLTLIFSDGFSTFDTSLNGDVTLTGGTDNNPQTNYIYILKSTKTLTSSTSDWPSSDIEHIKVAQIVVKTASTTKLEGALRNQNWNDHIKSTNDNGHLLHITEKLRQFEAQWNSGASGSVVIADAGANAYFKNTAGVVFQLHKQNFPILDMTPYTIDDISSSAFTISDDGDLTSVFPDGRFINVNDSTGNDGLYTIASTSYSAPDFVIIVNETIPDVTVDGNIADDLHVVNDFTAPYKTIHSITDQTLDTSGVSLNNTSYSVVFWGVMNKSNQPSHIMANWPSSTYSKNFPDQAVSDAQNYAVYSIPKQFQGVGFLIGRATFVDNGGVVSLYDYESLLGRVPNATAGGGGGGTGVTDFTALTDTPNTYTGEASKLVSVNSAETALEFTNKATSIVDDFTYSGANVTSYQITGLDLDADYTYEWIVDFTANIATSGWRVQFNTGTPSGTMTNYATHTRTLLNGAETYAMVDGENRLFANDAGQPYGFRATIRKYKTLTAGESYIELSTEHTRFRGGPTVDRIIRQTMYYDATGLGNLTSLLLSSWTGVNPIRTGFRSILLKHKV